LSNQLVLAICLLFPFTVQSPGTQPVASRDAASTPALAPPVRDVVESERAFARLSLEKGQREAFLAFFADDALLFGPEPLNAKKAIAAWPAVSPVVLDWEPRQADISADGAMGYTTGPWLRTAKTGQPPKTTSGWYFTIWRRQPDGRWLVAVDVGIDSPPAGALRPVAVTVASRSTTVVATDAQALLRVDRQFARTLDTAGGAPSAFTARGTESVRVYRNGLAPISGRPAARAYFAALGARYVCEPENAGIAASGDFGYTYGKYRLDGAGAAETGYYFRVWRQQSRAWKVAVDITVPGSRVK